MANLQETVQKPLSRRDFLRQSFAFSALAGLAPASAFAREGSQPPPLDPKAHRLFLLGDWGSDTHLNQQTATATGMKNFVDQRNVRPGALLMLGDNWYGDMGAGVDSPRWQTAFEQMYPASHFPGPAYAILGNHDYEHHPCDKVAMELDYAQHMKGNTRWTMPSRWYSFQYPQHQPLITFICLDSNLPFSKAHPTQASYVMTEETMAQQDAWFRAELAKPRTTPFLAVAAHHPIYTNGVHKDNQALIAQWDGLLRQHKVDFYFAGHDHDLQHLEFEGHPTSFIVSGGGGGSLCGWSTPPDERGPWGGRVLGFTDLQLSPRAVTLRHIDANSQILHVFRKDRGGRVELFPTAA